MDDCQRTGTNLSTTSPKEADWASLAPRTALRDDSTDVVMPVYRGTAETLRAIRSVLAARNASSLRLVVIDDASPEPALSGALAGLAARGLFVHLRNDVNRGFPATANRGMRLSDRHDVVLLNADTEVFDGWLDRLRAAAYWRADAGTATPLSNAATILSYPHTLRDNPMPADASTAILDRMLAGMRTPPQEIPTAVGFCMYIRRDCLAQVGPFDEGRFGRGYGEENDFCMRAMALGWRHLAALDTFVWHAGGRSFGAERQTRIRQALRTLDGLHPHYRAAIAAFIARDPIAPLRQALDIARIRRFAQRNRLAWGRLPPQHAAAESGDRSSGTLLLRPAGGWLGGRLRLLHDQLGDVPNLPSLDLAGEFDQAVELLLSLGVERVTGAGPGLPWTRRRWHRLARRLAGNRGSAGGS